MKALVINLASESTRMQFQAQQLQGLDVPFERIEAATPETLSPRPDDPYWSKWERPLRTTEMAAFASHRAAWQAVAEAGAPQLILEDDAVLMPAVPAFLDALDRLEGIDFVTLETRGRRKRFSAKSHDAIPMHRLWQDRSGAAAYVLWPEAARKLLQRVKAAPGLADAILCAAYDLSSWQAVPALACQLDRCRAEGIVPPIQTDSAIDREDRPRTRPIVAQRARRWAGQLRMALRAIVHANARVEVVPLGRD